MAKLVKNLPASDSVRPHRRQPTRLPRPWDSPGQNTGVGSLSLLQWIFPTQELNRGLLNCRLILYQLSYQDSFTMDWLDLPQVKLWGFLDSSAGKESICNAGDTGSISGLGRSPGEGIGYPLQYSWASLVA